MGRYALRRLAQLIPTLFGVIVITFILFNVVGGSPAALTLGKNVSPRMLEDFDEARGFNKPLFVGFWTSTRAYASDRKSPFPPAWRKQEGAVQTQAVDRVFGFPVKRPALVLEGDRPFEPPVLFPLSTNDLYRWTVECRGTPGSTLAWTDPAGATQTVALAKAGGRFRTPLAAGGTRLLFRPGPGGRIEVSRLTLDRRLANPFASQFAFFLGRLARLDFGKSIATGQPVLEMLREGIGPSLVLVIPIFLADLALAVALALVCAYFRNTWIDRFFVVIAVILMSVNYLVWIVAGQYVFAYKLKLFPIWGFESWRYLVLPWLIGTFSGLGGSLRFYRTIMLDEMYRDYVRTAFAKGLGLGDVLFKHVLKNAMIPILTNVVMAIPFLYTGSLLLESFFGIPGLGYLSVNALNSLDVDVVRAVVVIGTVLYILANLASDLCYALVDPRVRFE
jgi:peptide/nickel transport system permease protein